MAEAAGPETYGDRVVGFVDILGFSDLVRRAHTIQACAHASSMRSM